MNQFEVFFDKDINKLTINCQEDNREDRQNVNLEINNESIIVENFGKTYTHECDLQNNFIHINNVKYSINYITKNRLNDNNRSRISRERPEPEPIIPNNINGCELIGVINNPVIDDNNLQGQNIKTSIIDGGDVLTTHQEFQNPSNRITNLETTGSNDSHATHVSGTICATGIQPNARGVAQQALVGAYNFNGDFVTKLNNLGQNNYCAVNNSWGYITGWHFGDGYNDYYALTRDQYASFSSNYRDARSPNFGRYMSDTQSIDTVANNYPNMCIVWAAGNDRNDNVTESGGKYYKVVIVDEKEVVVEVTDFWLYDNGWYRYLLSDGYLPPQSDGDYNSCGPLASAKNNISIGATVDSSSTTTKFSSWGPTTDGRIKPDLVCNGESVYSTYTPNNNSYAYISGTSMASPFCTGCCALINQYYNQLYSTDPSSSTIKGSLIHGGNAVINNEIRINGQNGYGLIDMISTMNFFKNATRISSNSSDLETNYTLIEDSITNSDDIVLYNLSSKFLDSSGNVKITLVYNDLPGEVQSAYSTTKTIVNQLGLYFKSGNNYYYPYRLLSSDQNGNAVQQSSSSFDTTKLVDYDNVQKIILENITAYSDLQIGIKKISNITGTQNFSILLEHTFEGNEEPIFTSSPVLTATEDSSYTYTINVSDNDGDICVITAPTLPSWLNLTDNGNNTGVLSGTPSNDNVGVNAVVIQANDRNGGISNQSFNISVANVNDNPVFTSSPVLTATEDSSYTYTINVSDDDGDICVITAPTLPSWLNLTDNGDNTAVLLGTPSEGDVGDNAVVIQANDGNGGVSNQSFNISVANVNDNPVFTSSPVLTATVESSYTYTINVSDDDSDICVITAPTLPSWLNLTDNGNNTAVLSGTPSEGDVGDNAVVIQANDGNGGVSNQSFNILVADIWHQIPGQLDNVTISGNSENIIGLHNLEISYRNGVNGNWEQISGKLQTVSITNTKNIIGTNQNNIWLKNGLNDPWEQIPGQLQSVYITGDGNKIIGINQNNIWLKNGLNSSWQQIPGQLDNVSISEDGANIIGTNQNNIWYRNGINGYWQQIPGKLDNVAISDIGQHIIGTHQNNIWYRNGVNGTWQQISGQLNNASITNNKMTIGTFNTDIMYKTL